MLFHKYLKKDSKAFTAKVIKAASHKMKDGQFKNVALGDVPRAYLKALAKYSKGPAKSYALLLLEFEPEIVKSLVSRN